MRSELKVIEPLKIDDFKKGIVVPEYEFEGWLKSFDWTWHQLARNELPPPFTSLADFQLACICEDAGLWVPAFLREPEDPDHKDPYNVWDYQLESLRYKGSTLHQCGAEVGKTREIIAKCLHKMFTVKNGSGLIGAPMQTHLEEIIEAMTDQFEWNPDLGKCLVKHKKHPHHAFYLTNRFKVDFRPSGHDGEAYRGVHARTFAIKDEASKDKNKKQWSEFWRAMKPTCYAGIYSVPDGDRETEYYRLSQRAIVCDENKKEEDAEIKTLSEAGSHINNMKLKLFKWSKRLMPDPYWSEDRKKFYIEKFGGEDAPEYQHNVEGEHGDPQHTVFPWHLFKLCIKDIPEYRCLKILVDTARGEVIANGYRLDFRMNGNDPTGDPDTLIDDVYNAGDFFKLDDDNNSDFKKLIRSFFNSVSGLKRSGGDFGFSPDPTELLIKNIIGKRERLVGRLQLKQVTYDQQCQAIDALDDLYGPKESISWGTDYGNAGSAVAQDLYGLRIYENKNYEDRLKGFMFESTSNDVNEDGIAIIDSKTGKPAKTTLKELSTKHLTTKMQRQELEYPPDPDILHAYPNHTAREGKHRIFSKENDHIIDADRAQKLAQIFNEIEEDFIVCGSRVR